MSFAYGAWSGIQGEDDDHDGNDEMIIMMKIGMIMMIIGLIMMIIGMVMMMAVVEMVRPHRQTRG